MARMAPGMTLSRHTDFSAWAACKGGILGLHEKERCSKECLTTVVISYNGEIAQNMHSQKLNAQIMC